jgi:hypothetical protein
MHRDGKEDGKILKNMINLWGFLSGFAMLTNIADVKVLYFSIMNFCS